MLQLSRGAHPTSPTDGDHDRPPHTVMHPTEPEPTPPTSPRPKPTGWIRLWYAARHSLDGLRAGWREPAFRQEALAAALLLPAAFWLGRTWVEIALLVGVVLLVMVVELLNTAVESVVDRVGPQWHALSKRAKDLGSAAVLLALLLCVGVWSAALWSRLGH